MTPTPPPVTRLPGTPLPPDRRPFAHASSAPEKPVISEVQANWHVHNTAIEAQTAARAQGCEPGAATALLDGAVGLIVEGVAFPSMGGGLVLALTRLNELTAKSTVLQDTSCEMAAIAYVLYDTKAFWRMARQADVTALEDAVFEFMQRFSLGALRQITGWINTEYARLRGDAEDKQVGKPEAAATPEPEPEPPVMPTDSSASVDGMPETAESAGS